MDTKLHWAWRLGLWLRQNSIQTPLPNQPETIRYEFLPVPLSWLRRTWRMIWSGWTIPAELVATAASLVIGMTVGQGVVYVAACVALILIIHLCRSAIAQRNLNIVQEVYADGIELLSRKIEVKGSYGVKVINPWRDQWMANFEQYIGRIEALNKHMPTPKWREVTSVSMPDDPRFEALIGDYTSANQRKAQMILAGILCFLEKYINETL